MNKQNSRYLQGVCFVGLFILIHMLTFNPFFSLSIANAVPIMSISAVITVSFYYGEWMGFTTGVIYGIFADAITSGSYCFNAVCLLLIGLLSGVALRKYLNRNIFSAMTLSILASGAYFLAYGLIFTFRSNALQGFEYLLLHCLPSAVYSAIFIVPFYFLGKIIKKI